MRKAITKRVRFEIFKRDSFTCQYCSLKPPDVPIEIDHIVPVSKGGTNDDDNLITACFNFNRGKSNIELLSVPEKTANKIEKMKLAQKQYKDFSKILQKNEHQLNQEVKAIDNLYSNFFNGWEFNERFKISVKNFIKKLDYATVYSAMETACFKVKNEDKALKYFCGICWTKIRENE